MSDRIGTGGALMIKIDGSKVKQLRESQGLTQLYLATAVEVTTDTISRWENKRYPTIKQDNGLKLAEALDVRLEDILDNAPSAEENVDPPSSPQPNDHETISVSKNNKKLHFGLIACVSVLVMAGYYFYSKNIDEPIHALRIMPERTIANLPFPVVIEVIGDPDKPVSLILKEELPSNAKLLFASPKTSGKKNKAPGIKWIQKMTGRTVFAYMVKMQGEPERFTPFSGSVAVHLAEEEPIPVEGPTSISLGKHHWADTNADNIISDREILTVYDQYSGIEGFDINIDLIERMWLGSRYQWDDTSNSFTILP
jgi:transcriptional regulator with XRE-family HTH domain